MKFNSSFEIVTFFIEESIKMGLINKNLTAILEEDEGLSLQYTNYRHSVDAEFESILICLIDFEKTLRRLSVGELKFIFKCAENKFDAKAITATDIKVWLGWSKDVHQTQKKQDIMFMIFNRLSDLFFECGYLDKNHRLNTGTYKVEVYETRKLKKKLNQRKKKRRK